MRGALAFLSGPYGYAKALYRKTRAGILTRAETFEKHRLKRRLRCNAGEEDDLVVVAMVRDEALRLEYFFKYYKELGVDRFFMLDHQSADRSAEMIEAEKTATRISVAGNFIFKRAWIQAVLETVAIGKWCLVLDADEFLVWPQMQKLSLRDLIAYMDEAGFEVFPCVLLDMYPQGAISDVQYRSGQDPLDFAPFFDRSGMTRRRSFGVSPLLTKAPLVRFRPGMQFDKGQHGVHGARDADVSGVLLHFKFLQDFDSKIRSNPLIRTFDRAYGRELAAYREKLQEQEKLVLHSDDSLRYRGPDQLLELGLMKESAKLRDLAGSKDAPGPGGFAG